MSSYMLASCSDTLKVHEISYPLHTKEQSECQVDCLYEKSSPNKHDEFALVSWSGNFNYLAAATSRSIVLYDKQGEFIQQISHMKAPIECMTFGHVSSRHLFYTQEDSIEIWDRVDHKLNSILKGHKHPISCFALTTDDQRCASGSQFGHLIVHSMKHGLTSNLNSPFKQAMTQVQFYPFKKSIVAGSCDDGSLAFWDIHQKLDPYQWKQEAHQGPISDFAFAPCNKHLYCTVGLDKMLKFHDVQQKSNIVLHSFACSEGLTKVSINDDHSVAVGTVSGQIILYDVRWRGSIGSIQTNASIKALQFQPPKWMMDAAVHETFDIKSTKLESNSLESKMDVPCTPKNKKIQQNESMADVFSPIHKGNLKASVPLKKVALKKNLMKREAMEDKINNQETSKNPTMEAKDDNSLDDGKVTELTANQVDMTPSVVKESMEQSKEAMNAINAINARHEKPAVEHNKAPGGMVTDLDSNQPMQSTFQYQILEHIIQDCLGDFRLQMHTEIRNMHLELLRQFEIQKNDIENLMLKYTPNQMLVEELSRLREENLRLKQWR